MKTILVPTDGSEWADKALDLALDLAKQHGAAVKLLHVLLRDKEPHHLLRLADVAAAGEEVESELKRLEQTPAATRTAEELMANPNVPSRPAPEPLLRKIGAHVLQRASARASARDVAAETLEIADGAIASAIVAAAETAGADAIVMGTRGLRQIEAMTFGSASQDVCREAGCTCISVH